MIIQNRFIFKSIKEYLKEKKFSIQELEKFVNSLYMDAINDFDYNDIKCNGCGATGDYEVKGYYYRHIIICNYKVKIRILRIRCKNCRKTHAILFLDFVPYYQLSSFDSKGIINNNFENDEYDQDLIRKLKERAIKFKNIVRPYIKNIFKKTISKVTEVTIEAINNSFLQIHRGIVLLSKYGSP